MTHVSVHPRRLLCPRDNAVHSSPATLSASLAMCWTTTAARRATACLTLWLRSRDVEKWTAIITASLDACWTTTGVKRASVWSERSLSLKGLGVLACSRKCVALRLRPSTHVSVQGYQSADGRFASIDVFMRFLSTSILFYNGSQYKIPSGCHFFCCPTKPKLEPQIRHQIAQIAVGYMWTLQ